MLSAAVIESIAVPVDTLVKKMGNVTSENKSEDRLACEQAHLLIVVSSGLVGEENGAGHSPRQLRWLAVTAAPPLPAIPYRNNK